MGVPALSDAEVERRWPLWIALSETFLDIELNDGRYRHIAEAITDSGFSEDEAFVIYREDVAPAFAINLLSVAGEWTGWSEEYIRERVLEARTSWMKRALVRLTCERHIREECEQIRAFL